MPAAITMKDAMLTEMVDEDFDELLIAMNSATGKGMNFIVLDGEDGNRVMINMSNVLTIKQYDN